MNGLERELAWELDNAAARAEADKKYAKVVPINPAELVDEGGNAIDLANTRTLTKWLLSKYRDIAVEVKDDSRTVVFTRGGFEASTKRRGKAQRQMYADLKSLVEQGVYAGYELGNSEHPNVDRQNIYYAAAEADGQVFGVRFKIDILKGEKAGKGAYKDHKTVRVEVEKPLFQAEELDTLQQNSGLTQPPSLYAGRSESNVSYQNESGFFIAVPNIRQAFMDKEIQL